MKELGRFVKQAVAPLQNAIGGMLARAVVHLMKTDGALQVLQIEMLVGELKDGIEYVEPYGYTSTAPKDGREAVAAFIQGDRSNGIVLVVANRRYRLKGLKEGEVAIYDDTGQKIVLQRDSILVKSPTKVVIDAPLTRCEGDFIAKGEIKDQNGAKSMSGMRSIFNSHTNGGSGLSSSQM